MLCSLEATESKNRTDNVFYSVLVEVLFCKHEVSNQTEYATMKFNRRIELVGWKIY